MASDSEHLVVRDGPLEEEADTDSEQGSSCSLGTDSSSTTAGCSTLAERRGLGDLVRAALRDGREDIAIWLGGQAVEQRCEVEVFSIALAFRAAATTSALLAMLDAEATDRAFVLMCEYGRADLVEACVTRVSSRFLRTGFTRALAGGNPGIAQLIMTAAGHIRLHDSLLQKLWYQTSAAAMSSGHARNKEFLECAGMLVAWWPDIPSEDTAWDAFASVRMFGDCEHSASAARWAARTAGMSIADLHACQARMKQPLLDTLVADARERATGGPLVKAAHKR